MGRRARGGGGRGEKKEEEPAVKRRRSEVLAARCCRIRRRSLAVKLLGEDLNKNFASCILVVLLVSLLVGSCISLCRSRHCWRVFWIENCIAVMIYAIYIDLELEHEC